jgi:hypothetical protein
MEMQAKNVLYAAVGAPVVAARKVGDQVNALKEKIEEEKANYGKVTEKTLEAWAAEGEKILARLKEGKVVEELSSKMDLDQAKEQVGKLRDQLEEMLETWRQSFRPEKAEEKTGVKPARPAAKSTAPKKPAAKSTAPKKPAAKSTAPKKPAAKKQTSAAKTTKSSTAAKTSSAKSSTPKGAKAS